MIIFVKTFDKTISLDVDRFESIDSIKTKIQQREDIPVEDQRIIFGGKQLETCLNDYDISKGLLIFKLLWLKSFLKTNKKNSFFRCYTSSCFTFMWWCYRTKSFDFGT